MLLLTLSFLKLPIAAPQDTASQTVRHAQLSALVDSVAAANLRVPRGLRGYRAVAESEFAVVLRGSEERENLLQVEQLQSVAEWNAGSGLVQRIIGYRSQSVAATVSALTWFHRPWIVPTLYGNRLSLTMSGQPASPPVSGHRAQALEAVHPFGADRRAFYTYSGGDTVEVLRADGRVIPIVRIDVAPAALPVTAHVDPLLFRGEIDVDATSYEIVRMRGELLRSRRRDGVVGKLRHLVLQREVFVELENGEFAGRYWLPTYQRVEAQLRSSLASELRPIVRVVTRFRRHELEEGPVDAKTSATIGLSGEEEGVVPTAARLVRESADSTRYLVRWARELGEEASRARGSDFDDVAPDAWRTRGVPRVDYHAEHLMDVLRFNRVEGVFTGASAMLRLRDRLPGALLGGVGGYAWSESAWRGAAFFRRRQARSEFELAVRRELANSNDFRPTIDFESSLMAALVTADDYDYFDRRSATIAYGRALGGWERLKWRVEAGPVSDRSVVSHVQYGLFHADSGFRANRTIDAGQAWRSSVSLSFHPNVSGEMLEPGIGAGVRYERGDGTLSWQRVDGRLIARHLRGAVSYAARLDVAAAFGSPVPRQQLIEFGENEGLPGYLYKEFGGDRAALLRGSVAYSLPILRAPVRARLGGVRGLVLPSLSPALTVGVQSGWAGASATTRAQLALFGTRADSLTHLPLIDPGTGEAMLATRPTNGIRTTVGISLRLFGGAIAIGMARGVDHRSPWRLTLAAGQGL